MMGGRAETHGTVSAKRVLRRGKHLSPVTDSTASEHLRKLFDRIITLITNLVCSKKRRNGEEGAA